MKCAKCGWDDLGTGDAHVCGPVEVKKALPKMRLYWIAYHYSDGLDLEMLDGPYGTRSEAESERESMMELFLDENLVIVRETRDVELA